MALVGKARKGEVRFPGGPALRKARERAGVTREIAGTAVGRSAQTLGLYETCKLTPPRRVLIALVKLYGADLDDVDRHAGGNAIGNGSAAE